MENNMELIKVTTTENGSQVVSARELHKFLESKQIFQLGSRLESINTAL